MPCSQGLVAGTVNIALALVQRTGTPRLAATIAIGIVGFFGYGVSLVLFVLGLRHLGTARTGAYFSLAPFIGALLSVLLLHDLVSIRLFVAGGLMAFGLWLHLSERHEHEHRHEAMEHEHSHIHDEHHQHTHRAEDPSGEPHTHRHLHRPLIHKHPTILTYIIVTSIPNDSLSIGEQERYDFKRRIAEGSLRNHRSVRQTGLNPTILQGPLQVRDRERCLMC